MMLTFTVDPDLFPEGAEAAFKHVTGQRAVAQVMKAMKVRQWFSVIEWHESGWPHWHVLVPASFIDIRKIEKEWARFVPRDRRHLMRIGTLGMVRYSKRDFASPKHAALYASKYLTKYPEHGFPHWVMEAEYRIRRFSTSRGFWGELSHRIDSNEDDEQELRQHYTHAQRLQRCCSTCSVYEVVEEPDRQTGELVKQRHFMRRIACHGGLLAGIVKQACQTWPEFPAFVRGAFIAWRGTWATFCECFRGEIEHSIVSNYVSMRIVGNC